MKKYKKILKKRHLLVIGGTELERTKFITKLIEIAGYQTFRFPKKIESIDDYYNSMKKMKLYEPWYEAKSYNGNTIWDFHRDWISENNSLLVLEEIQNMEERWKHEIIRLCLDKTENREKGKDTIHLIISQEYEDNLIEKLSENEFLFVRENEKRTRMQIVEQNLKIIDITEIKTNT